MTFHGFDGVRSTQPTLLGLPAIRRRVFYRLGMLAQLTEEHNYLQTLGATARKIQDKFSTIWPLEVREMPLYTAFR